jgi:hypothetical protein
MHSSKGYIVPIVLVLVLLTAAGFLIFTQKPVESPTADTLPIFVATSTPSSGALISSSTPDSETDQNTNILATTTASTSPNTVLKSN